MDDEITLGEHSLGTRCPSPPSNSAVNVGRNAQDGPMIELQIRPAVADDGGLIARIFFDAFEAIATRHGFPIEAGTPEFADFQLKAMLNTDGIVGLVAERGGEILGSALEDERGPIVGIGPVVVAPRAQDAGGVGRTLMEGLLQRSRERGVVGVRLVQTAYNYRSLSLYAKLGFVVREPLSVFQGEVRRGGAPSRSVRSASPADLAACNDVCRRVHGHDRSAELANWIGLGSARVAEVGGRITGYATGFGYAWHAVGEANEDIVALLQSAEGFVGLGILVPSRNTGLMQWCLNHGLALVQQSTLMTIGLYNEPQGAWLPSIAY
jgi:predicted N-acetyltransferase YhbS